MRPHGYARYKLDGCRCRTCSFQRSEYQAELDRRRRSGDPIHVDVAPTAAHLAHLRAQGMGTRRIAEVSGVSRSQLRKIELGLVRTIRSTTAGALLIVDADLAPKALVDARFTWRLLTELIEAGVPKARIAQALHGRQAKALQLDHDRVTQRNADKVCALYLTWCKTGRLALDDVEPDEDTTAAGEVGRRLLTAPLPVPSCRLIVSAEQILADLRAQGVEEVAA